MLTFPIVLKFFIILCINETITSIPLKNGDKYAYNSVITI